MPDARRVYTTFEQPDLKSVFTFTVTAPEHWTVISNAATPSPTPAGDGTATWSFPTTERMSTYITALVAGEYHAVHDIYAGPHGDDPARSLLPAVGGARSSTSTSCSRSPSRASRSSRTAFDYPYPFGGKYDQAYVPEYNMGAMENAGCVTFRDEYLPRSRQTHAFYEQRANTVLHEMAHMWFGDLVTMRWWDDLWLNESFAEWAAHHAMTKATKYTDAWTGFTNARKNWAYRQDQLPSTHPIAADNHDLEAVEVNFDGITYAKGASTLKQLVAWVGEDEFLDGLRSYFKKHAFANSEFSDLLAALEASSGRDLGVVGRGVAADLGRQHARAGLRGRRRRHVHLVRASGRPRTRTSRRCAATGSRSGSTTRWTAGSCGGRSRRDRHRTASVARSTQLVGEQQPDLVLLNDGDLTYAKIRLDERSLATLVSSIDTLDDSLARALCWGAAWDMTRDAEMTTTDFAELVLRGVGTRDRPDRGRARCSATPSRRSTPTPRPPTRAALQAALGGGARRARRRRRGRQRPPAGVRPRLRAAAAHATTALDRVQGWYDGTGVLDGLTVDTDLRWTLLTALAAARSGATTTAIDAELERDNTISGQERAAAARTVLPDARRPRRRPGRPRSCATTSPTRRSARSPCTSRSPGQDELLAAVRRALPRGRGDGVGGPRACTRPAMVLQFLFPRALADPGDPRPRQRLAGSTSTGEPGRRCATCGRAPPTSSGRWPRRRGTPA